METAEPAVNASSLVRADWWVGGVGTVNLSAVGVLLWFSADAFISLWCLWAAVASVAIAAHLRRAQRPLIPA